MFGPDVHKILQEAQQPVLARLDRIIELLEGQATDSTVAALDAVNRAIADYAAYVGSTFSLTAKGEEAADGFVQALGRYEEGKRAVE